METKKDYSVGYCRPPQNTQFQKGKSGNPRGRRKKSRNVKTILARALGATIRAREGDKVRNLPALELLLLKQLENALKGDQRAWSKIMELTMRYPELAEEPPEARATAEEDDRALQSHLEQLLRHRELAERAAQERRSVEGNVASGEGSPDQAIETPLSSGNRKR
jgi:hypothetical protein